MSIQHSNILNKGAPNMDPKEKGPLMDLYKWPATSSHLQLLIFEVYSVN